MGILKYGGGITLAFLIAAQSGCGTAINLSLGVEGDIPTAYGRKFDTEIYGGILTDVHGIEEAVRGNEGLWWSLIAFPFFVFIDFPLSLVADTLTLPYTVPYVLTRPEPKRPSKP